MLKAATNIEHRHTRTHTYTHRRTRTRAYTQTHTQRQVCVFLFFTIILSKEKSLCWNEVCALTVCTGHAES